MNFEWISKLISQRFGTHFGVHFRILRESREGLGSWELASSDFDRFWIDFRTPLGAKLAPTSRPWRVLGRLDTSWGGPCVVWNPLFSDLMSNSFSHGILHRFRTAKRSQNHWKMMDNHGKIMENHGEITRKSRKKYWKIMEHSYTFFENHWQIMERSIKIIGNREHHYTVAWGP